MRRAAITIDVDSLHFYAKIHGLPEVDRADDPIYTIALPRLFELLSDRGVPATLFLVGADVEDHAGAITEAVRALSLEVASHSFSHDYALSRRAKADIDHDLLEAERALAPINGGPLSGFRAPGYNVTPDLMRAVVERGYRYDSSLLPAPAYFAARAAAILRYRFRGAPSASLTGDPRQFGGPLEPYRCETERPWRRGAGPLIELPMACEPMTRTPLIGTSWPALPAGLRDRMLDRTLDRLPVFNFEMHAIDLLDRSDSPALAALSAHQVDLRISALDKYRAFGALIDALKARTEVTTLRDIAGGDL